MRADERGVRSATIRDTQRVPSSHDDSMESFVLGCVAVLVT
jgi:hypothetical protein